MSEIITVACKRIQGAVCTRLGEAAGTRGGLKVESVSWWQYWAQRGLACTGSVIPDPALGDTTWHRQKPPSSRTT